LAHKKEALLGENDGLFINQLKGNSCAIGPRIFCCPANRKTRKSLQLSIIGREFRLNRAKACTIECLLED
jgi:hypothetical protein